jgi:ABC-2 type transport system permease protein
MNKLWVIARKDIGEAFRSRSTYVFVLVMAVLAFSYFKSYTTFIDNLAAENASKEAIIEASRSFMNNIANALPMMYSIFVCSIFANYSVIMDKAKHNIESLMVTPVSLKQIWLGKSLAVTLPSFMVGIGMAILVYIVMNFGVVIPRTGSFIIPDVLTIVSALIIVPVLIFAIVAIVIYVQLVVSNPRIASLVFTAMFIMLLFGVNILGTMGISTNFAEIYLGIIVLCAIISFILSRSLTKEKVLLSSKG